MDIDSVYRGGGLFAGYKGFVCKHLEYKEVRSRQLLLAPKWGLLMLGCQH
jgi:hypothetical protein